MLPDLIAALWKGGVPALLGIHATLRGYRVIGKKPGTDEKLDRYHRRFGTLLKVGGPLMIAVGVFISFETLLGDQPIPPAWQTATTSDGVCTVEMPGTPVSKNTEGSSVAQILEVQVPRPGNTVCLYQLLVTELPQWDMEPREKLKMYQRSLLDQLKMKLVSERDLDQNGFPGREFELSDKKGSYKGRAFLVNNRFYFVFGLTGNAKTDIKERERVLQSVKLQKKAS